MKKVNLAIVGATGLVGLQFIKLLEESEIEPENLYLLTSPSSVGKNFKIKGRTYVTEALTPEIFERRIDFAFFCASGEISKTYGKPAADKGIVVIDNSSHFRLDSTIPLIVPEINLHALKNHNNIIANPNCVAVQTVLPLYPLHREYTVKRVVISTYQAISGAGRESAEDLLTGLEYFHEYVKILKAALKNKTTDAIDYLSPNEEYELNKLLHPLALNLIPQIDSFEGKATLEEKKIISEIQKIMDTPQLPITVTSVRVPVLNGHSESLNIEFEKDFVEEELTELLAKSKGLEVIEPYPMPLYVSGKNSVAVGRIRRDTTVKSGINLFCVGDNLRKGAALNGMQILEELI